MPSSLRDQVRVGCGEGCRFSMWDLMTPLNGGFSPSLHWFGKNWMPLWLLFFRTFWENITYPSCWNTYFVISFLSLLRQRKPWIYPFLWAYLRLVSFLERGTWEWMILDHDWGHNEDEWDFYNRLPGGTGEGSFYSYNCPDILCVFMIFCSYIHSLDIYWISTICQEVDWTLCAQWWAGIWPGLALLEQQWEREPVMNEVH